MWPDSRGSGRKLRNCSLRVRLALRSASGACAITSCCALFFLKGEETERRTIPFFFSLREKRSVVLTRTESCVYESRTKDFTFFFFSNFKIGKKQFKEKMLVQLYFGVQKISCAQGNSATQVQTRYPLAPDPHPPNPPPQHPNLEDSRPDGHVQVPDQYFKK